MSGNHFTFPIRCQQAISNHVLHVSQVAPLKDFLHAPKRILLYEWVFSIQHLIQKWQGWNSDINNSDVKVTRSIWVTGWKGGEVKTGNQTRYLTTLSTNQWCRGYVTMSLHVCVCHCTSHRFTLIAQLVHAWIWKSMDRRFEPHFQRGVFLVWAFSKPLASNC